MREQARQLQSGRRKGGPLSLAASALKTLLFAAAVAGVVYVGVKVRAYLRSSDDFSVREIEVKGCEKLRPETLLKASGLERGMNIFSVDVEGVLERLLGNPWVRSARLMRRLPSKIVVELNEHTPALVVNMDHLYLADDEGEVFKRWNPADGVDLPVLSGLGRAAYMEEPASSRSKIVEALGLTRAYEQSGLGKLAKLQQLHISGPAGFDLIIGDGTLVRVGSRDFERQLRRLAAVAAEISRVGREASYILLDRESRPQWVVARLKDTTGSWPPMPRPERCLDGR